MGSRHISVSPGFLVVLGFLYYLDEGMDILGWGLLASALHELGHMSAIYLLGGRIDKLQLTAVGAELGLDPARPLSYGGECLAALAGPAVNLLLAWAAAREKLFLPAGLSLGLGLFNLLPMRPLDGGRCLYFGLSATLGCEWADWTLRVASTLTIGLLFGLGLVLMRRFGNITLLITSLWLLLGMLAQLRRT